MTKETEANLALLMAALRYLQEHSGDVPPPGKVTPENLSALARELDIPLSISTIRRVDSLAIAKARHAATQRGLNFYLKTENQPTNQ